MKARKLMAAIVLSLAATLVIAQQQAESADEQAATSLEPTIDQLQEAQTQWDKIIQTTDPEERHRLMMEYREKMHSTVSSMRAMHQAQQQRAQAHANPAAMQAMHGGASDTDSPMDMSSMMAMMAENQGMMAGHQGMMMGMQGMMEAHRQMDKRLDLMQTLLEQLLTEKE